jgi:hypothetical protein
MLALAAVALAAALPQHGILVPGRALGGVRLGETPMQVERRLGRLHGVCDGCPVTTWYFTYKPFTAQGLGVEFRKGRVEAVYTLASPPGWSTTGGFDLGAPATTLPPLRIVPCTGYKALVARTPSAVTVYYVADAKLWGFGLLRPSAAICR